MGHCNTSAVKNLSFTTRHWIRWLTFLMICCALTHSQEIHCRHPEKDLENNVLNPHYQNCKNQMMTPDNPDTNPQCVLICAFNKLGLLDEGGYPIGQRFADIYLPPDLYPETNHFFSQIVDNCTQEANQSTRSNGDWYGEDEECSKPIKILECAAQQFLSECYKK